MQSSNSAIAETTSILKNMKNTIQYILILFSFNLHLQNPIKGAWIFMRLRTLNSTFWQKKVMSYYDIMWVKLDRCDGLMVYFHSTSISSERWVKIPFLTCIFILLLDASPIEDVAAEIEEELPGLIFITWPITS